MDKLDTGDILEKLIEEFIESNDPQCKRLGELSKQAHINRKRLEKTLDKLQEKLDDLLVCIKYNLFDLEATRRENKQLIDQIRELNEDV
jgi:uncharacterized protein YdhG (YjbR/CyaY superfamily)